MKVISHFASGVAASPRKGQKEGMWFGKRREGSRGDLREKREKPNAAGRGEASDVWIPRKSTLITAKFTKSAPRVDQD